MGIRTSFTGHVTRVVSTIFALLCLTAGSASADECITVRVLDSYGDGNNGVGTITNAAGTVMAETEPFPTGTEQVSGPYCLVDGLYTFNHSLTTWLNEFSFSIEAADATVIVSGNAENLPATFVLGDAVPGCIDPVAENFNAVATEDDGSCTYIDGCMNPTADNYDEAATNDDGSCSCVTRSITINIFDSYGDGNSGTGTLASGEYVVATTESFSGATEQVNGPFELCLGTYTFTHTLDTFVSEFSFSIVDDGGETIASGGSADLPATITLEAPIPGCTDPFAANYDEAANQNDGSCDYPCDGHLVTIAVADSAGNGNTGTGTINGDTLTRDIPSIGTNGEALENVCLLDGTYTLRYTSDANFNQFSFSVTVTSGALGEDTVIASGSNFDSVDIESTFIVDSAGVYGCSDESAGNYDETVTEDNGSCVPFGDTCEYPVALTDGLIEDVGFTTVAVTQWYSYTNAEPGFLEISACIEGNTNATSDTSLIVYDSCETYDGTFDNYTEIATAYNLAAGDLCPNATAVPVTTFEVPEAGSTHVFTFVPYASWAVTAPWDFSVTFIPYVQGCTDPTAMNYDPDANQDDGTCELKPGCMNPYATNFDPEAAEDDGSCEYDYDCGGQMVLVKVFDSWGDGNSGNGTISNTSGDTLYTSPSFASSGEQVNGPWCLENGLYFFNHTLDLYVAEFTFSIEAVDGSEILAAGDSTALPAQILIGEAVPGCIDNTAVNFDPAATADDGGCFFAGGCTDETALNFNPDASNDDGSCFYPEGCMDPAASNYDAEAVVEDDSCVYDCEGTLFYIGVETEFDAAEQIHSITTPTGTNVTAITGVTQGSSQHGPLCLPDSEYVLSMDFKYSFHSATVVITTGAGDQVATATLDGSNSVMHTGDEVSSEPPSDDTDTSSEPDSSDDSTDTSDDTDTADDTDSSDDTSTDDETTEPAGPSNQLRFTLGGAYGCMDEDAVNFDGEATVDNGTCEYQDPGMSCENPLDAVAGENQATGTNQWFTFTTEQAGYLTVSSCTGAQNNAQHDTTLGIFASCEEGAEPVATSGDMGAAACEGHSYASQVILLVEADEVISIFWSGQFNPEAFVFTVQATDCAGVVDGTALVDACGVCDDDPDNDDASCTDECGVLNGEGMTTWYVDGDGDGYGVATIIDGNPMEACEQPEGYVDNAGDLDDASSCEEGVEVDTCGVCGGPGMTTYYLDLDGDGLGDPDTADESCTEASAGWVSNGDDTQITCATNDEDDCGLCGGDGTSCIDCNDVVNGSSELDACGVCDGPGAPTWYADFDDDGLGDPMRTLTACAQPPGYIEVGGDFEPDSECEEGVGVDICGRCGDAGELTWYADPDGDALGNADDSVQGCGQPDGYTDNPDDTDPDCATNDTDLCGICGGDDTSCQDCAGVVNGDAELDECGVCNGEGISTWYADTDGDGLGDPADSTTACEQPDGYSDNADDTEPDCATNDTDECGVCGGDGTSCQDCNDVANGDAEVDECGVCGGEGASTWYADTDGDGLGDPANSITACEQPEGYTDNADDTDDTTVGGSDGEDKGGGGCSASGAQSSQGLLWLLVGSFLIVRRRQALELG